MRQNPASTSVVLLSFALALIPSAGQAGVVVRDPAILGVVRARATGILGLQQSAFGAHLGNAWNSPILQAVSSDGVASSATAFGSVGWDPSLGVKMGMSGLVSTSGVADAYAGMDGACIIHVTGAAVPYTFNLNVSSTTAIQSDAYLFNVDTDAWLFDLRSNGPQSQILTGSMPAGSYVFAAGLSEKVLNGGLANFGSGFDLQVGNFAHLARVTDQPPGTIVDMGLPIPTLTLPINVTGDGPPAAQWYRNGTALHDGGGVGGSATTTLTITNFATADSGAYTCVIGNSFGNDTSDVAICEADHVGRLPLITSQPGDQALDSLANMFAVRAFSSGPLTYQWAHGGVPLADGLLLSGAIIAGSQGPALLIVSGTAGEGGSYQCTVTNAFGSVQSVIAHLTTATSSVGPEVPGSLQLSAGPSPARTAVSLAFDLPFAGPARVDVFDVAGRRVRTLEASPQEAGHHVVPWDLGDASGTRVAPGLYLARLTAGDSSVQRRVVVMR